MNLHHYVLDENGNPRIATMWEWAVMFTEGKGRIVKQEYIGKYQVSTVFLGLDHSFSDTGPPVLWESMVFHPNPDMTDPDFKEVELDGYTERCAGNKEQAEAMHQRVVERVKEELL